MKDASPSFRKATARLPCPDCGSDAEPLYMKHGFNTDEWFADADPFWGCANCGHCLVFPDLGEDLPYTPPEDARWGKPLAGG